MNVISVGGLVSGGELGGKLVAGGAAGYCDVVTGALIAISRFLYSEAPHHTVLNSAS